MNVPQIKGIKMSEVSGIKGLVGKKMSKQVDFMGSRVTMNKLKVADVLEIQEKAKTSTEADTDQFAILKTVIRMSIDGGEQLTEEDFAEFPLEELSSLSAAIMKYSGLGEQTGK